MYPSPLFFYKQGKKEKRKKKKQPECDKQNTRKLNSVLQI
jgi:hypothetical protein